MSKKITVEEHNTLINTFRNTPIIFPIQPFDVMVCPDEQSIIIDPTPEKISLLIDMDLRLEIAQNIISPWFGGIDHFLKAHWNSKHKIKGNRVFKTATRPKGLIIKSLWEICKEIKAPDSDIKRSTVSWFARCIYDLIEIKIEEILTKSLEVVNNNHKKALADRETEKINQLRDLQNPFTEYTKAVEFNRLIKASVVRADKSDRFVENYWRPLISTLRQDVTEQMSERWGWTRLQNGSLCTHIGRGRPKKQKPSKMSFKL
ncbi:MAG: hypothetical protein KME22_03880 [Hassallia sp. WJT32-NPBG1]|jgi:hypothetical protein|nr:hypothetical protein [Spirirestis rafaelensis WJT71-NPBG6]MBW4606371.1 hypothetical protein [Hassallia sp. WJT32-NPBG1]